jgi:flavin-dependent dehydrogenase
MNNSFYDIAIVGGGLAGLTFALQAKKAGYSVVLFEKESYPFHKVCGEYISMESWNFLTSIGVPLATFNLPIINHLSITDVKGNSYQYHLPQGGFGVSRFFLDNYLYELCVEQNVTVHTNCKVEDVAFTNDVFTVKTSTTIINSKIVVGSFGKKNNLDISWKRAFAISKPNKLNNFIGIKYHALLDTPTNVIALHNFKDGYCGMSKIEENKVCICYITTANNLKLSNNSIDAMQQQILSMNPSLKLIFEKATFIYKKPLVISQISFQSKSQIHEHILLLGDACGLIAPLCGNGMSMAMHSSKIAFTQVDMFLQNKITRKSLETNYQTAWKKQFANRLFWGKLVQRFFGNNYVTIVFLKCLSKMPFLANWIIKQTHGKPF